MTVMNTAKLGEAVTNIYEKGLMRVMTSDGYGLMCATTEMDLAMDSDAGMFLSTDAISSWVPTNLSLETKVKVRAWLCPFCRRMTLHKPERQESCEGCGSTHWNEVLTEE